jgi:transcriptional regulator GlxA family with amidase domain
MSGAGIQSHQVSSGRSNGVLGVVAPTLIGLLKDASDAIDCDSGTARSRLAQAMTQLLSVSSSADNRPGASARRGGLAPWQENRVRSHIEAHLDEPIRVTDLAAVSRLSVRCFSVALKQNFGASPNTFILLRRVEHAQTLMSSTNQPLADIALACGFCDQAHFCRRFRQITGRTPKAWRREHFSATSLF